MSSSERLKELVEQIVHHNDLYFNKNKPEISDTEYDELIQEAQNLALGIDPDDPVIAAAFEVFDSVGAIAAYGSKVEHPSLMGSLAKENTIEAMLNWRTKLSKSSMVVAMPKMDGCAIRLMYDKGRLWQAATRGNGTVGQDVTANVRALKSIPNIIPYKKSVELRGEIYMKKSVFEQLTESGTFDFANPRNASAGSLMQKDAKKTAKRKLSFRCYNAIREEKDFDRISEMSTFVEAECKGIEFVEPLILRAFNTYEEFSEAIEQWESDRAGLDYEIDGIVFASNSVDEIASLGIVGKRPVAMMAFKFKAEQKNSVVKGIHWQAGRSGRITPVADIIPTRLAGSTIRNITLHNYGNIQSLKLQIGDEILFEKAGDVIPQVVRVTDRHGRRENKHIEDDDINFPKHCPSCGKETTLDARSIFLLCMNITCPAKIEREIIHYINTLEIKGIGPEIVRTLLKAGLIKDIPGLYYLRYEDLVQLPNWGDKSAQQTIQCILEKGEVPLWQFVASLGIQNIGKTMGKALAKEFKTLDAIRKANTSQVSKIEGLGSKTAKDFVIGIDNCAKMIDELLNCVDVKEVEMSTGPLVGKSFCMTGALPSGKKRNEMAAEIEAAGGEVKSGVGKGLDFLVIADPTSTSGKAKKARKLGTECISEEQLDEMMKG